MPEPVAGFETVFVVCTLNVLVPSSISIPAGKTLPPPALVYCTYNVAGSEPVAATTSSTFAEIVFAAFSNMFPTILSLGKALVVVFNLTNL